MHEGNLYAQNNCWKRKPTTIPSIPNRMHEIAVMCCCLCFYSFIYTNPKWNWDWTISFSINLFPAKIVNKQILQNIIGDGFSLNIYIHTNVHAVEMLIQFWNKKRRFVPKCTRIVHIAHAHQPQCYFEFLLHFLLVAVAATSTVNALILRCSSYFSIVCRVNENVLESGKQTFIKTRFPAVTLFVLSKLELLFFISGLVRKSSFEQNFLEMMS